MYRADQTDRKGKLAHRSSEKGRKIRLQKRERDRKRRVQSGIETGKTERTGRNVREKEGDKNTQSGIVKKK